MFYGIGGVRLIISFVHNEEDSYKAVGENISDIVNNSWHIYHKDISTYAALSKAS